MDDALRNAQWHSLLARGFCIIDIPAADFSVICQARDAMQSFFELGDDQKVGFRQLFSEHGCNQGLAGYNRPSAAKEVFRVRRGLPLAALPVHCAEIVIRALGICESIALSLLRSILRHRHVPETAWDEIFQDFADVSPEGRLSCSPFDFFLYHNSDKTHINCHEHVDPGTLTIVPLCPTAGLAVMDVATGNWCSVEDSSDTAHGTCATVFLGRTLAQLLAGTVHAAVHRVDVNPTGPRLSCVYELRPPPGLML